MLVSGVPLNAAKAMYFAVRWGGPRWEVRVSLNTNLLEEIGKRHFVEEPDFESITTTQLPNGDTEDRIVFRTQSPLQTFDDADQRETIIKSVKRLYISIMSDPSSDDSRYPIVTLEHKADGITLEKVADDLFIV
jgi:hypothetical protein